jgi:hypothetical protein
MTRNLTFSLISQVGCSLGFFCLLHNKLQTTAHKLLKVFRDLMFGKLHIEFLFVCHRKQILYMIKGVALFFRSMFIQCPSHPTSVTIIFIGDWFRRWLRAILRPYPRIKIQKTLQPQFLRRRSLLYIKIHYKYVNIQMIVKYKKPVYIYTHEYINNVCIGKNLNLKIL